MPDAVLALAFCACSSDHVLRVMLCQFIGLGKSLPAEVPCYRRSQSKGCRSDDPSQTCTYTPLKSKVQQQLPLPTLIDGPTCSLVVLLKLALAGRGGGGRAAATTMLRFRASAALAARCFSASWSVAASSITLAALQQQSKAHTALLSAHTQNQPASVCLGQRHIR